MFAGIVQHKNDVRFQNEIQIEAVRMQRLPQEVTRLAGMYFFEDLEEACTAITCGGHFRAENLAELEVHPVRRVTRIDSNWLTYAKVDDEGRFDQADLSWIDNYWAGQPFGNSPV